MSKDLEDTLQEKVAAAEVMGWVGITRKKF